MKKVLLVDLCTWQGHHESYFLKILAILEKNGYFVYASCVENEKLRQKVLDFKIQNCDVTDLHLSLSDKILRRALIWLDKFISLLPFSQILIQFSSLANLIAVKRLIRYQGKDMLVFFADSDSIIPAVPTWIARCFLPKKWIGLSIQPSYRSKVAWGKSESCRQFYAENCFGLASCQAILVLDPKCKRFFNLRFKNVNCIFLPELTDTTNLNGYEVIEEIERLADHRAIVSILGHFIPRKNLLLFLESVRRTCKDKIFAVIVGQLPRSLYSTQELHQIDQLIGLLDDRAYIRLEYYIPNEQAFNSLLKVSDLIFVHYKDHPFSSNILAKAMMLRKPVITSQGFLMEQMIKRYGWQVATDEKTNEIAKAIEVLTANFTIDEVKYETFLSEYSNEQFEKAILLACDRAKPTATLSKV